MKELQRLWLIEATKYNVVPMDDRRFERINAELAGRPEVVIGNSQILFKGMRVSEHCVIKIQNKSHSVTAEIEIPKGVKANGVIITQGGEVGGWSLYAKDGKLKYCYNFFGINYYIAEADKEIPEGKHEVRVEFKYDGGGSFTGDING